MSASLCVLLGQCQLRSHALSLLQQWHQGEACSSSRAGTCYRLAWQGSNQKGNGNRGVHPHMSIPHPPRSLRQAETAPLPARSTQHLLSQAPVPTATPTQRRRRPPKRTGAYKGAAADQRAAVAPLRPAGQPSADL